MRHDMGCHRTLPTRLHARVTIVVGELSQWQTLVPLVRVVQYTSSKHILKNLIYPLCLTIGL
jgi:hypothetical protein